MAATGCMALLVLLQLRGTVSARWTLASATILVGFALSRSLVSHAVSAGMVSWPVAIETAHLLLISAWLGEVLIAGLIMLRAPCSVALHWCCTSKVWCWWRCFLPPQY